MGQFQFQGITWRYTEGFVKVGSNRKRYPTFSAALEFAKERSARKPKALFLVGGQGLRPGKLVNYRLHYVQGGNVLPRHRAVSGMEERRAA